SEPNALQSPVSRKGAKGAKLGVTENRFAGFAIFAPLQEIVDKSLRLQFILTNREHAVAVVAKADFQLVRQHAAVNGTVLGAIHLAGVAFFLDFDLKAEKRVVLLAEIPLAGGAGVLGSQHFRIDALLGVIRFGIVAR